MIGRIILSRVVFAIVTLWVVSMVIFWSVELLPGDPAKLILGREATSEAVTALRARLRLNDPPLERYGRWLAGFARGDWGESLAARRPVSGYVLPRVRNTIMLTVLALALYIVFSITIGTLCALFRDRIIDTVLSAFTLLGISMPEFVVGILLILVLAVLIPLFPPLALMDRVHTVPELLYTLCLPALTLALVMTAYAARMIRSNLIEVLESDYVRLATLKGLSAWRIVFRHSLPNALGPTLNVTALNIAWLIGGVVVVETVFDFPGLGRLLVDSISFHDVPVVEAITVMLAAVYIATNLVADILAIVLNPRLRATHGAPPP